MLSDPVSAQEESECIGILVFGAIGMGREGEEERMLLEFVFSLTLIKFKSNVSVLSRLRLLPMR